MASIRVVHDVADAHDALPLATPGNIAYVVERLRSADARTFASTCRTLINNLTHGGLQLHNQAAAVQGGVIEAVLAQLARVEVSAAQLAQGANAGEGTYTGVLLLNTLCAGSAEHRARALRAGAVTPVVAALQLGSVASGAAGVGLSEAGGVALYSLTAHSEAAVGVAVRAGAVEALMACVRAHVAASNVQARSFSALYNLAAGKHAPGRDAAARATRLGAVEAAAAALRAHGRTPAAQDGLLLYGAASLLSALARRERGPADGDARAGRCRAAEALLAAAERHVSNARFGSKVATALGRLGLAISDEEWLAGLAFMSALLHAHRSDAAVAAEACNALHLVLDTTPPTAIASCSQSVAACALVPLLVAVLREHGRPPGRSELSSDACASLLLLVAAAPLEAGAAAVRCGAAEAVAALPAVRFPQDGLLTLLKAAAERHDAAPGCELAAGAECTRCAAQREDGRLCGAPGCPARRREGGGKLARCAGCRTAAYCGAEHQRIAWRCGHKAACAALATQRSADNSSSAAV